MPGPQDATARLADAFHAAMSAGDLAQLAQILTEDAVLYSDGGGKKLATLNPIYGHDKILRFVTGIASKRALPMPDQIERTTINGLPGFVLHTREGIETLAIDVAGDQIVAIYAIRNPDKLRHLA